MSVSPSALLDPPVVLGAGDAARPFAYGGNAAVPLAAFHAHVRGLAACLPAAGEVVNLCEDRYRFIVALAAAALRGQTTLLPPSRAPAVVAEVLEGHAGAYALADIAVEAPFPVWTLPDALPQADGPVPRAPAAAPFIVGFTSGSTGRPRPYPKTLGAFARSTAQNLAALAPLWEGAVASVVATVPPQHMYGMELSVMLPLLAPVAVHGGRPFFPQDVAAALAEVPAPRVLVTTPVHLRALVESGVALPPLAAIVSATAPLPQALARQAEERFGAPLCEVFGSTETCIVAHRRTAREAAWTPMPGVAVRPRPDGAQVLAPHLDTPVVLSDLVDVDEGGRFVLRGRQADLLEIAGKRASLGELTARLLAVPGVHDAAMVQLAPDERGVARIGAVVVAPGLDEAALLAALRVAMDPVFLPRRIRFLEALPRAETGKLPRDALMALLRG
jgi:acyl-coenzyme A synthetase/AMP-(fatty) acid ligase